MTYRQKPKLNHTENEKHPKNGKQNKIKKLHSQVYIKNKITSKQNKKI